VGRVGDQAVPGSEPANVQAFSMLFVKVDVFFDRLWRP
jgi:hypothetical protein